MQISGSGNPLIQDTPGMGATKIDFPERMPVEVIG